MKTGALADLAMPAAVTDRIRSIITHRLEVLGGLEPIAVLEDGVIKD